MMMEDVEVDQRKQLPNYLLDAAGISIERMPMLNVIFDRMAASCTDSLQPMAGTPCYFSVNGITNDPLGDIIKDYEGNAVAAVLYAEQWDSRVIIMLDRDFVFTMVEAMFGSDGAEPPLDVERTFSNIEIRLVQALFERFAKARCRAPSPARRTSPSASSGSRRRWPRWRSGAPATCRSART
ncbi:flagellar motor switch protein FliM [Bradyrhizobium ottawaense]